MAVIGPSSSRTSRWTRDLPPLGIVLAALALLAMILPNALRIPQQDPSPVLEYAPVPPTDESPPNPQGNMSSLALGSSSTVSKGAEEPPPPPPPPGTGDRPSSKRCVGKPPRQTEDLMSPPCVPFFEGNNFGATWRGVTKDEFRVVVYHDRGNYADEPAPPAGVYDIDKIPATPCPKNVSSDPETCSHILIRMARALSNYFNNRFQTYKRRAHVFVHYTDNGSPRGRRADAASQVDSIEPFAILDQAVFDGYNEEYVDAAGARDMLVFSSAISTHTNAFYRRNAPLAWGFWPDVEHWAELYTTYVCTKVAPFRVSHSGGPNGVGGMNGTPRKFGFFYTTDPREPGLKRFRELVEEGLRRRCGVTAAARGTFPQSRFVINGQDPGIEQAEAVSKFIDAGVTTVLYLGGVEGQFSKQASARGYFPEIVVAGDLYNDNTANARLQAQDVWKNAWSMSYQIREDRALEQPGYQAAREGDPNLDEDAALFAAEYYRDYFMLFQGVQVAGPRLTPKNIDKGFHAIPEKSSSNPFIAACFFDPGDYTCAKDAMEMWWDPRGTRKGSNTPGCWRMINGGRRFLAGTWPKADEVFARPSDPCQGRGGTYRLRTA